MDIDRLRIEKRAHELVPNATPTELAAICCGIAEGYGMAVQDILEEQQQHLVKILFLQTQLDEFVEATRRG